MDSGNQAYLLLTICDPKRRRGSFFLPGFPYQILGKTLNSLSWVIWLSSHQSLASYCSRVFWLAGTAHPSWWSEVKVIQLCSTLFDPMDCSLPGSSVHEILQAGILEWVAIPFSRGSSQPRDQTMVSSIADGFLTELLRKLEHIFCPIQNM